MIKPKIKKIPTKKRKPSISVDSLAEQTERNRASIKSICIKIDDIVDAINKHTEYHASMWEPGQYDPSENQKGFIDDMRCMKIHHSFNYRGQFIVIRVFGGYIYLFENKSGNSVPVFVPVDGLDGGSK